MSTWQLINQSVVNAQPVNDLQTWAVQSDKLSDIMQQVRRLLPLLLAILSFFNKVVFYNTKNLLNDFFTSLHLQLCGL